MGVAAALLVGICLLSSSVWADQMIFQRQVSPSSNYTNMYDAKVSPTDSSTAPGNPYSLYLNSPVGAKNVCYFDVSSLPAGSTVTKVTVEYDFYSGKPINASVGVFQVTTNWVGGAAWKNKGGDWVDLNGTPQGPLPFLSVVANYNGWYIWDVTLMVQRWVKGTAPNYGILIIAASSATNSGQTYASGYLSLNGMTFRPILRVTYTPPSGDSTPPTGTVTINSGATYTNTSTVTLTLSATDNSGTVSLMKFSNDGTSYSSPEPYNTTKTWTLTSGDGTKTVYAKFADPSGNWSSPATDTIILDTAPPTDSVIINAGAAVTNTRTVTLTLSATDNSGTVSQMKFSNDGASYSSPEPYGSTKTWTLTSGDGTKTVYAKFSDPAGNWSSAVTDTIVLDTTPPTPTITAPTDGQVFGGSS